MRKIVAGGAVALFAGLVGLVTAGEPSTPKYDIKSNPGTVEGAIIRTYKDEKLIELKVEKVYSKDTKSDTNVPKDDTTKKMDEKMGDLGIKEGQVIFLHVADSRVFDANGKELKREDKDAWFSRDQGWAALKDGKRVKAEFTGTHELPAPRGFPRDARAGGNILVYHCTMLHILTKD